MEHSLDSYFWNINSNEFLYDKIYKDFSEIKENGTLAIQLKVI